MEVQEQVLRGYLCLVKRKPGHPLHLPLVRTNRGPGVTGVTHGMWTGTPWVVQGWARQAMGTMVKGSMQGEEAEEGAGVVAVRVLRLPLCLWLEALPPLPYLALTHTQAPPGRLG